MFPRLILILSAACAVHAPAGNSGAGDVVTRMKMMVQRFDGNKDGVLSKSEFSGRPKHWRRMDRNRDGQVNDADFAALRTRSTQGGGLSGPDISPAVGESAGDFTLKRLGREETVTLSDLYADKPVVLTFGSYTCPPFRRALEGMEDVYQTHKANCHFYFIYIKEAHASDGRVSGVNLQAEIRISQHLNFGARSDAARLCTGTLKLSMPVLLDGMGNAIETRFSAWPNRCYLIDKGGIIRYKGRRGPSGTTPHLVQAAIQSLLN
jgi:hypothetical protein